MPGKGSIVYPPATRHSRRSIESPPAWNRACAYSGPSLFMAVTIEDALGCVATRQIGQRRVGRCQTGQVEKLADEVEVNVL